MERNIYKHDFKEFIAAFSIIMFLFSELGCQKTGVLPSTQGVASLTIVNAIPNSNPLVTVINSSQAIVWFNNAFSYETPSYGGFYNTAGPGNGGNEYAPLAGNDTVYVVQFGPDTANVGPKATGQIFHEILPFEKGGIYSLFLCGSDTTSTDYVFNKDSLPFYPSTDSVTGIRFVNLSTGSNPISINLEGSPTGSEVQSLPYKGVTTFKAYTNNSTTQDYFFVIRDAATGDSLTQFDFNALGGYNNGYGMTDPLSGGQLLTFKNVTIAVIGQPGAGALVPRSAMLIDNY